jgi:hypothetical protein
VWDWVDTSAVSGLAWWDVKTDHTNYTLDLSRAWGRPVSTSSIMSIPRTTGGVDPTVVTLVGPSGGLDPAFVEYLTGGAIDERYVSASSLLNLLGQDVIVEEPDPRLRITFPPATSQPISAWPTSQPTSAASVPVLAFPTASGPPAFTVPTLTFEASAVSVPLWPLLVVLAAYPLVVIGRRVVARRIPVGHCQVCGYDLRAHASGMCPECGTRVPVRGLHANPTGPAGATSAARDTRP